MSNERASCCAPPPSLPPVAPPATTGPTLAILRSRCLRGKRTWMEGWMGRRTRRRLAAAATAALTAMGIRPVRLPLGAVWSTSCPGLSRCTIWSSAHLYSGSSPSDEQLINQPHTAAQAGLPPRPAATVRCRFFASNSGNAYVARAFAVFSQPVNVLLFTRACSIRCCCFNSALCLVAV